MSGHAAAGGPPPSRDPGLAALLRLARAELPPDAHLTVDQLDARLDEPVRVAITGRVKAGKSTLLNALVGERLAATGVGERTRLVSWYRWGQTPEVRMVSNDPTAGEVSVPFWRTGGELVTELPEPVPAELDHLSVRWPAPSLRRRMLIDTPGLGALDSDAGLRTATFLGTDSDDSGVRGADAMVYLLRHRHHDDLAFLEAFGERGLARPTPVNAVGVLSRADEIGGGDLDALEVAARVAARYREDPLLRPLCQTVVPVCGLLAETAGTLTDAEARALVSLGDADPAVRAVALRSVDDLRDERLQLGVSAPEREVLLTRLGLFGLRRACAAVREGHRTPGALADELRRASGLDGLVEVIDRVFGQRGEVLTARTTVLVLAQLAAQYRVPGLHAAVEEYRSARHEWRELEVLVALRAGHVPLPGDAVSEAATLLGGEGTATTMRLGLPADTSPSDIGARLQEALDRWQRRAAQPLAPPLAVAAADAVVRSLEGMIATLR
jgi:hypothetical protein